MQTFLPYEDFRQSARVLDSQRLGKQRLECAQILAVVEGRSTGWASHPAVRMWMGHPDALMLYMNCVLEEWHLRGYRNSYPLQQHHPLPVMPSWLGDPRVHRSHQSKLLHKNREHYKQFGWLVTLDLPYHWPLPGDTR